MSRILVVEPSKMLQQALAFALAPEHQIEITDRLPDGAAPGVEIAVIDPAAHGGPAAAGPAPHSPIADWQIPIIWLGPDWPPGERAPAKLVCLHPPLERDSLKRTIADLARSPTGGETIDRPKPTGTAGAKQSRRRKEAAAPGEREKEVIDLVDVVDDQSARRQ
jgi:hypothetical protein